MLISHIALDRSSFAYCIGGWDAYSDSSRPARGKTRGKVFEYLVDGLRPRPHFVISCRRSDVSPR